MSGTYVCRLSPFPLLREEIPDELPLAKATLAVEPKIVKGEQGVFQGTFFSKDFPTERGKHRNLMIIIIAKDESRYHSGLRSRGTTCCVVT